MDKEFQKEVIEFDIKDGFSNNLKGILGEKIVRHVERYLPGRYLPGRYIALGDEWDVNDVSHGRKSNKPLLCSRNKEIELVKESRWSRDKETEKESRDWRWRVDFEIGIRRWYSSLGRVEEMLEERGYLCNEKLIDQYYLDPSIDRIYFAAKVGGKDEVEVVCRDHGGSILDTLNIELPVLEDYRIIYFEVKTSSEGKWIGTLTDPQRRTLQISKKVDRIEFYIVRINPDNLKFSFPKKAEAEIKRFG